MDSNNLPVNSWRNGNDMAGNERIVSGFMRGRVKEITQAEIENHGQHQCNYEPENR